MSSKTNYRESIRQEILSLIKNEGDRRRSGSVVVLPPHHAETPAAPKGFTVDTRCTSFCLIRTKGRNRTESKTLARIRGVLWLRMDRAVFSQPSEQNVVGGSRSFEVCLFWEGRSNCCRGCHKDCGSWILDKRLCYVLVRTSNHPKRESRKSEAKTGALIAKNEQERSQALPRAVSLEPELVKSIPGGQPGEKRKQLIVSPEPPPMKDVTEQAEIPRLGDGSDADDEPSK